MNNNRGFTLIELMMVVGIIGILSAISYPSYQSAVQESRRAAAAGDLVELAGFMERWYTTNSKYTGAALPFTVSPKNSNDVFYDLSVATSDVSFALTATPSGAQASDYCGTLRLDERSVTSAAVSGCW